MIAFFVNYSAVALPLHLPTLSRQQFFGAVAKSLGKNSYFPLPLDVRRCVAREYVWFTRLALPRERVYCVTFDPHERSGESLVNFIT